MITSHFPLDENLLQGLIIWPHKQLTKTQHFHQQTFWKSMSQEDTQCASQLRSQTLISSVITTSNLLWYIVQQSKISVLPLPPGVLMCVSASV